MNINIYYGGRGLVDDPTILVINKIQEVLDELNVNVNRYNLYEMKNTITTLSQTVTEADGIILATTVEWVGMGGYMQTFLDSCWLYSDKSQILDKYMFPVVMARTYGEREVTLALNNSWEIIGGKIGPALSAYIDDTTDFEFNDNYKIIIEKYAENVYRTISQRIMQLPSSSQTIKNNMLKDTIKLTPQESEQLSKYASDDDQIAEDEFGALIDNIYVEERTDSTDEDCKVAKEAWDKLTDAQKELVTGEEASPEYFGRDTGDASKDDPRNQDEIGENELLVVSFGTSFNDSREEDIKGIEDALAKAYPDWSVRRAFTAQIIINHVQARDDEVIDNMQQALDRAVANGVKNLVVQPTHLMHGAEYDEMTEAIDGYKDKFESVAIAEPMLGEVGDDATVINDDKKAVAQAITDEACKEAGFDDMKAAADAGTAFVFMGHGTSHTANVTYDQMQTQMDDLGFTNAFIGTVEGEPEDTACDKVIEKVKEAGFKNVILRPLMVVAGDHANNDMAGDDEDSWKSQFEASGDFDSVDCQIAGLGRIAAVEDLYVAHTKAAIDSLGASDDAAAEDTDAKATDDSADDAQADDAQADDAAETTADTAEADAE